MVTPDASPAARHAPKRGLAPASSYSTRRDRGTMTAARSLKSSCASHRQVCSFGELPRFPYRRWLQGGGGYTPWQEDENDRWRQSSPRSAARYGPDCCTAGGLHPCSDASGNGGSPTLIAISSPINRTSPRSHDAQATPRAAPRSCSPGASSNADPAPASRAVQSTAVPTVAELMRAIQASIRARSPMLSRGTISTSAPGPPTAMTPTASIAPPVPGRSMTISPLTRRNR